MTQPQRDIRRKMNVLGYVKEHGNVAKACRHFGISRQCYYNWLHAYERRGEAGLIDSRPCPENHKLRTPKPIEDKIVHLRTTYHFGPHKIAWYLERYLDIKISPHGVYNVLRRNGLGRLPANTRMRSMPSVIRYEKQVPGHHVQVDVWGWGCPVLVDTSASNGSSQFGVLRPHLLVVHRAAIAQCGMPPVRVVEALDETEHREPGLVARLEAMPVHELVLDRRHHGFGLGVVVSVAA